jgi:serine/threonine protein kinase
VYEVPEHELADYPQIRLSSEHKWDGASTCLIPTSLKYLLVMDRGAADLSDVISHGDIAGLDVPAALGVAAQVARCLQFLNEEKGVMHGDVKGQNFVDMGRDGITFAFAAVDLDAATLIGASPVGVKIASTGNMSPEHAAVVLSALHIPPSTAATAGGGPLPHTRWDEEMETLTVRLKSAEAAGAVDQQKELRAEIDKHVGLEPLDDDIQDVGPEVIEVTTLLTGSGSAPPPRALAHKSYDMWSFGVLLFQLCTGYSLFTVDAKVLVGSAELAVISACTVLVCEVVF